MTNHAPTTRERSRSWGTVALAAVVATGVAFATARLAAPSPAAPAGPREPDESLQRELAELRREVAQLRFALQLSAATDALPRPPRAVPPSPAPAAVAHERGSPAAPAAPAAPRYERFEVPTSAVTVRQGSSRELVVWNSDPSLAGQTIEVLAWSNDRAPEVLRIVVPPVDGR